MEFMECVENRRSVRKYKADKPEEGVFEKIVQAASYAPSWKNSQTVRYIVVEADSVKNEIAERCVMDFEYNQKTIQNAPAIILVTTIASRSGYERDGSFSTGKGTHWESFDAGIATGILCLAAHEQGLGTVVMGIFDEEKVRQVAGIPDGQKLSAMVAVGYPEEQPAMPKRKGVEELLSIVK
ncbi:nitroreductase family protein [Christensenellaceae bacterium OttesenSCG-928-K19]|nr:nitroreductase family protein [Christensenellaceae bacterium OttesenSCG-928-K19]